MSNVLRPIKENHQSKHKHWHWHAYQDQHKAGITPSYRSPRMPYYNPQGRNDRNRTRLSVVCSGEAASGTNLATSEHDSSIHARVIFHCPAYNVLHADASTIRPLVKRIDCHQYYFTWSSELEVNPLRSCIEYCNMKIPNWMHTMDHPTFSWNRKTAKTYLNQSVAPFPIRIDCRFTEFNPFSIIALLLS